MSDIACTKYEQSTVFITVQNRGEVSTYYNVDGNVLDPVEIRGRERHRGERQPREADETADCGPDWSTRQDFLHGQRRSLFRGWLLDVDVGGDVHLFCLGKLQ